MLKPCLIAAAAVLMLASPAAAAPKVVASIKPIHALVAGVMAGVGEPALIVAGASSPHLYTMRPSDARHLAEAEMVFWVGPIFEGFLAKSVEALAGKAEVVELDKAPGIAMLPARKGGTWEGDVDHPAGSTLEQDGHLWLDPRNAGAVVDVVASRLSLLDSANAARYRANATALKQRLDRLDAALRDRLMPVRGVPFVVFHDAYQYLERRYQLDAIGSIAVSPERRPGARRLQAIRDKITALGARCVFTEPQFEPRLVATVTSGTKARTGVLDPEGTALAAGPDLYFTLMDGLADALLRCLGPAG